MFQACYQSLGQACEFYVVPGSIGLHPGPQSVGLELGGEFASGSIDGRSVTRCIDGSGSH